MGRRRLIAASAAALAGISLLTLPALRAQGASSGLTLGVPTVVDPIRGGAEPYIAVDRDNQPFVSAPGGTSVQTSWYWTSRDHGLTYQNLGPSTGHWVCDSTGGGDSSLAYDKVANQMYLMDQQALVDVASGRYDVSNHTLAAHKCFSDPALTADRPFQGVLHPTGTDAPPQWTQGGHKPMVYLSWQCTACLGGNPVSSGGGLAFAWSTDGVTWNAADPGVPANNPLTAQFFESPAISSYVFHGPTVADPKYGYVYTAISCSTTSCPVVSGKNEFGVAVGKPAAAPADRADPTNVGQFASMTYQTAANTVDGQPIHKNGSLFPVLAMDKAGTLYEEWIEGDGVNDPANSTPDPQEWHVYYTYSKDRPEHKQWAPVRRVDLPSMSKTNAFGWMTAGDKGKIGFVWLGTDLREQPTKKNPAKKWHLFMSAVTDADTASPKFHEARAGRAPMHIGDICLQGTTCAATLPPGNRNMADFISVDIGPDGAMTATYAADSNLIAPLPTDLVPGIPVTMTVHQLSGPRLIGSGEVSDSRFSTKPTHVAPLDALGDALFPVPFGTNRTQADLRAVSFARANGALDVTINVANLAHTNSPSSSQSHLWYLVTWVDSSGRIWFARAESDNGGELTYHAGAPGAYDRPGIAYYTIPTLVDYRGGTAVQGKHTGSSIVIHVPNADVGSPSSNAVLEAVTAWTATDNGLPPFDTATNHLGNVPSVIDATPAYDVSVSSLPQSTEQFPGVTVNKKGGNLATTGGPGVAFGAVALAFTLAAVILRRRRRAIG
ncbi:MAG: hypothetical protein ACJ735_15965 [Actinomycetes bacterium]